MIRKLTAVLLMSIMVLSGTVMSFAEENKNNMVEMDYLKIEHDYNPNDINIIYERELNKVVAKIIDKSNGDILKKYEEVLVDVTKVKNASNRSYLRVYLIEYANPSSLYETEIAVRLM